MTCSGVRRGRKSGASGKRRRPSASRGGVVGAAGAASPRARLEGVAEAAAPRVAPAALTAAAAAARRGGMRAARE